MASKLEQLRAKAQARRQTLCADLGLSSSQQLTEALHSKAERRKMHDEKAQLTGTEKKKKNRPQKREEQPSASSAAGTAEYTDSSTFLKGTNSKNPHNDYCQNFIDTGQVCKCILSRYLNYENSTRQTTFAMFQSRNDSPNIPSWTSSLKRRIKQSKKPTVHRPTWMLICARSTWISSRVNSTRL